MVTKILPGAEPFYFPGGNTGCLLIHGFTGSPSEVRWLGEQLHIEGFTVSAVLLKGHGTKPQDLATTRWQDWYASAEEGLKKLQEQCDEVYLIGLSMGGLIALRLSLWYQVKAVVTINSPIFLVNRKIRWLPIIKLFKSFYTKEDNPIPTGHRVHYGIVSLRALGSLVEFIRLVKEKLSKVTTPVKVVQTKDDLVVQPRSASFILDHVGSEEKEIQWLDSGGHVATAGPNREMVLKEVMSRIAK